MRSFSERDVVGRDFMDRFLEASRAAAPLMQFLTKALDLPWSGVKISRHWPRDKLQVETVCSLKSCTG